MASSQLSPALCPTILYKMVDELERELCNCCGYGAVWREESSNRHYVMFLCRRNAEERKSFLESVGVPYTNGSISFSSSSPPLCPIITYKEVAEPKCCYWCLKNEVWVEESSARDFRMYLCNFHANKRRSILTLLGVPHTSIRLPYDPLRSFYVNSSSSPESITDEINSLTAPDRYYKKPVVIILTLVLGGSPYPLKEEYAISDVTLRVHNANGLINELDRFGVLHVSHGEPYIFNCWSPRNNKALTWKYAYDRRRLHVMCTRGIKWPVLCRSDVVSEGSYWKLLPEELRQMIWGYVRGM